MSGGELELTFDPWAAIPLEREAVTVGVPFPPGALPSPNEACLFDGDAELYAQRQTLSSWPDGSVRWLLLDFAVDLPPSRAKGLRLRYGHGPSKAVLTETGVSLIEDRHRVTLDNGPLRIVCRKHPCEPFESIHLLGTEVLAPKESLGFRLTDLAGTAYTTAAADNPTVTLEARGPVRAAVRLEGSHLDEAGHPLLDFSILMTTWSDKPYVVVDYQVVHRGGGERVELQEVSYNAAFSPREPLRLHADANAAGPPHPIELQRSPGAVVVDIPGEPPAPHLIRPDAPGAAAPWVSRWAQGVGIAVGVRHALEQFPKRLRADAQSLTVGLYPPSDHPLRIPDGAAKSHQILFLAHGGEPDYPPIAQRFRLFNLAPRPRIPLEWYHKAQAFGARYPSRPCYPLDVTLDQAFDNRPRALGILHFGDEPHPALTRAQPNPHTLVWSNNAGDLAHALVLHYARTGELRHFAAAEALVRHVLDLDHVHFSTDPLRDGGLAAPDVGHCLSGTVGPAHQWIEGLLDHHYLTGTLRSLLAVRRIGQNLLRHVPALLDQPPDQLDPVAAARALYTAATLYQELGKPHYFEAARKLLGRLAAAADHGHGIATPAPGRSPLPDAAIVLSAIERYHLITEDQRAADLFVGQLDPLLAAGPGALWRHAGSPAAGSIPIANALLLEPLAFAWRLTGQSRYLDIGRPLVRRLLRGPLLAPQADPDPRQALCGAFVHRPGLWPAAGPDLACLVRPLLAYLAAAEDAGQLEGMDG